MSLIYKKIIKCNGVDYYLSQNKSNSRKCYIESNEIGVPRTYIVASIDNKTNKVIILDNELPKKVIDKINFYGSCNG